VLRREEPDPVNLDALVPEARVLAEIRATHEAGARLYDEPVLAAVSDGKVKWGFYPFRPAQDRLHNIIKAVNAGRKPNPPFPFILVPHDEVVERGTGTHSTPMGRTTYWEFQPRTDPPRPEKKRKVKNDDNRRRAEAIPDTP
jgi:hypothetical protein